MIKEIGEFLIEDFIIIDIYEGGFGRVYICYSNSINIFLAFKTFKNRDSEDSFRKEAKIWAGLDKHPNIVNATYYETSDENYFIAMEPILPNSESKQTLRDYINSSSLLQILEWSIQLCHGMEYANSNGVSVHRDIKPENIMIGLDNILKITDFGLAKVKYEDKNKLIDNKDYLFKGTMRYMSPESFDGESNLKTDIYSFGVVMYEMLSKGKFPFDIDENNFDWEEAHKYGEIIPLDSKMFNIVKKCLEKNPNNRYDSFSDLRKDLENLFLNNFDDEIYSPRIEKFTPEDHMVKGHSFFYMKDYDKFDLEYKKAIKNESNSFIIRLNYGIALLDIGRYEEASLHFKKACELEPDNSRAHFNLGHSYECRKLFNDAIFEYKTAISLNNSHLESYNNLGLVYMKTFDVDKAIEIFKRGLNIDSNFHMILMNLGFAYKNKKNYDKSIECYKRSEKSNQSNAQLYYMWGLTLQEMGQKKEARLKFIKAITIDAEFIEAHIAFEESFSNKSQLKKSISRYNELLKENPDKDILKLKLGFATFKNGLTDKGMKILDKLIESNSKISDEVWLNKGLLLMNSHNYNHEKVLECFNKSLNLNPKNIYALEKKGEFLTLTNHHRQALECYEEILKLNSTDVDALSHKGSSLFMLGRIEEGEDCFIRAIELDSENIAIYLNKGAVYGNLGNHLMAILCFEDALEIDKSNIDIILAKGKAHMNLHEYDNAIKCFDAILNDKNSHDKNLNEANNLRKNAESVKQLLN